MSATPPSSTHAAQLRALAERIVELRTRHGLNQTQLGAEVYASKSAIGDYEDGKTFPRADQIIAMCDLFDVSADYLLGRTNVPHGLAPNYWLVDLAFVEDVRAGKMPDPSLGDEGAVAIPERSDVIPSTEYQALAKELKPLLAALRKRQKRKKEE